MKPALSHNAQDPTPAAIWWIRRDLRLHDNQALAAAIQHSESVIPLFILDPALLNSPYSSGRRIDFLMDGLRALRTGLQARGSALVVRQGHPLQILRELLTETGAGAIFAEADHSPYATRRDHMVSAQLPLSVVSGVSILPPGSVLKQDGDPYIVYGPFARRWRERFEELRRPLFATPDHINTPTGLASMDIPTGHQRRSSAQFESGEVEAGRRLQRFLEERVHDYAAERDRLDQHNTSTLSPYIRFGMISPYAIALRIDDEAARATQARQRGLNDWRDELIWRDYFTHLLHHFPHVRRHSYQEKYRHMDWLEDPQRFEAWTQGRTGYPVVDAAMRQLQATGWISNRARMIVASFLVKHLRIHWQEGERWFMQQLIDGDPAANNGNWQWVAGTGAGAAPYFRIFNPVTQGKKYDPQGHFIRRWLPELANVPVPHIHSPWQMSEAEQRQAHCIIGQHYPAPIVEHRQAREETLAAYQSA